MLKNNIRTRQKEAIEKMLNFNVNPDSNGQWEDSWKILVFDSFCRDIISPLFHVADLRRHGVTLFMSLEDNRQPITDVPAVYFIKPTPDNIRRIIQDCQSSLYDSYYFNFVSSIPRPQLETLADGIVQADAVEQVVKIFDQYLDFVALDDEMFSLNMESSFRKLSGKNDMEVEACVDGIVASLFSVLATLGVVPIIRCLPNTAAGMVGEKLNQKIKDHLMNTNNLFAQEHNAAASFHRPVLILVNRDIDMCVQLAHTWTYQPLVHDLLGMKLNKVTLKDQPNEGQATAAAMKSATKQYDLTPTDNFWRSNAANPFPKVADNVEAELTQYKKQIAEINAKKGSGDERNVTASELVAAVESLPELAELKRIIDMHTNIATALLTQIKERELDNYYSLEDALCSKAANDKNTLLSMFSAEHKGTNTDKLRLFLIFYLTSAAVSEAELEQYESALSAIGCSLGALKYLKILKQMKSFVPTSTVQRPAGGIASLSEISSRVSSAGFGWMKNLVAGTKELALTKLTDELMELKPGGFNESYATYDPKMLGQQSSSSSKPRAAFREAIVFVCGGGNFVEHNALQELASKPGSSRSILYGSTEISSPTEFLQQLTALGDTDYT